jgi:hypothetical protein
MSNFFADLHCHPLHLIFNEFRGKKTDQNKTPWNIPRSKLRKLIKSTRTGYTQSDVAKMFVGGVRLVFVAIYPMEQGYFMNTTFKNMSEGEMEAVDLDTDLSQDDMNSTNDIIIRKRSAWFVKITSGLSTKRIKQIQQSTYAYSNELSPEIEFWKRADNIEFSTPNGVFLDENGNPSQVDITGKYSILKNAADLNRIKNNLIDDEIMVVFTVEGSHFLTRSNAATTVFNDNTILENVNNLKNQPIPIFYLTIAHHFDNGIVAHAHSIPSLPLPQLLMPIDQSVNLNVMGNGLGISLLGKKVILRLLNLVENMGVLEDDPAPTGKRILIDTKHLSALARREYYNLIRQYNSSNPTKKIPIIASHSAYSGVVNLETLIANASQERNDSLSDPDSYLMWNINVCNEDIQEIVSSEGLLGLVFEQRVLGIPFNPLSSNNETEVASQEVFRKHIRGIADAAREIGMHQFSNNSHSIWNSICIGSDFDGGIDPVKDYPTVLHFEKFRADLRPSLLNGFGDCSIDETNVDSILDLICFKNCHHFLLKHFQV